MKCLQCKDLDKTLDVVVKYIRDNFEPSINRYAAHKTHEALTENEEILYRVREIYSEEGATLFKEFIKTELEKEAVSL